MRRAQGEAPKLGPVTLWTLLAISCLNLMSFTAMYPITPKLMKRYAMKSEIGVGLVASSFALGRFLTTSCWPCLGIKQSPLTCHRRALQEPCFIALKGTPLSSLGPCGLICI